MTLGRDCSQPERKLKIDAGRVADGTVLPNESPCRRQSLAGHFAASEPGMQLRRFREQLGLSMRDVEDASSVIAASFGNADFTCPLSRISDIESKGVVPNIYRLFSFSAIYGKDFRQICRLYGIDWDSVASARQCARIPKTHPFSAVGNHFKADIPTEPGPAFDLRATTNVARMLERWGTVPAQLVSHFSDPGHSYAFVGTEDLTMYPIVMPGSFLEVDETKNQIATEGWRSEYERPIYFIETRNDFICAWCRLAARGRLIIEPHPLSPAVPRLFRYPQEAEIIGQVVGIAMRLDRCGPEQFSRAKPKPTVSLN